VPKETTNYGEIIIPVVKTCISKSIFLNSKTISKAKLICTETKENIEDNFIYYLSADGGSNWEEVQNNVEHLFTNTGTDLRFKIVGIGTGGANTYITNLKVTYTT